MNDKQHKFWSVQQFFSQVRSTDHRPQAIFFTSENNLIGFPAFSGTAARQNDWKWILETFAAFQEKTQKCSKHNQLFGGT